MFVFFQSCLSSHCYGGMSYYFSVRCCQIFKFYFSIFGIHYSGEIYLVLSDLAVLFDVVHVEETQLYSFGWYPFSSTSFSFAVQDKILQLATLMLTFFQTSFSLSFLTEWALAGTNRPPSSTGGRADHQVGAWWTTQMLILGRAVWPQFDASSYWCPLLCGMWAGIICFGSLSCTHFVYLLRLCWWFHLFKNGQEWINRQHLQQQKPHQITEVDKTGFCCWRCSLDQR